METLVLKIFALWGKIVTASDSYCFGSETRNESDETAEAETSAERRGRPHSSRSVPPPVSSICSVNKHSFTFSADAG